jgi:acetyl esterase
MAIDPVSRTREHAIDIEDLEYRREGGEPLLARIFKPRAAGPFPLLVELHGGAWCRGSRLNDTLINEALARSGVLVAALDFRMPPAAPYPASLADISYAIRWLKSRAKELRARRDRVGILGVSSGGHQAMLLAMRPRDPRYSSLELASDPAIDARVQCAVLCWPVIDPLARYRYAKSLKESGKPYPNFVDEVLPAHDLYWQTEEAMAEGNPTLALERGEAVELPPVLYLQGAEDIVHPRESLERFVSGYRKAGGRVELELYDGEGQAFITRNASSPAARRAIERIVDFVHRELA